jgi:hypothetical protein
VKSRVLPVVSSIRRSPDLSNLAEGSCPTGFRFDREAGITNAAHPEHTAALQALMTTLMCCD